MKTKLLQTLCIAISLLLSIPVWAQQDKVSGVLRGKDGIPLPGVNVLVKGTAKGTVTNFDGEYEISCALGDTLVFSYIGFDTREVKVTSELFGKNENILIVEKKPVLPIKSAAYLAALKQIKKDSFSLSASAQQKQTYNRDKLGYFSYNTIKDIEADSTGVTLTHFKPNVYFEVGLKTRTGFQFVKERNLPRLQNTYSQGQSRNGVLSAEGPETGTVFSYGPQLNLLAFDGTDYDFDTNGQLVTRGDAKAAEAYDNTIFKTGIQQSNTLFFNLSDEASVFNVDLTKRSLKDLYNIETSTVTNLLLGFKNSKGHDDLSWDAFVRLDQSDNQQPNLNGFQNNILLNTWATPISFSNAQGVTLADGSLRSFSPHRFNNPEGLLRRSRNSEQHRFFAASLKNRIKVSYDFELHSAFNYSASKNTQAFGVDRFTVGFENGYRSNREVEKTMFSGALGGDFRFQTHRGSQFDLKSTVTFLNEGLAYHLFQEEGDQGGQFENPQHIHLNAQQLHRNTLRFKNAITYQFKYSALKAAFIHNAYVSSLQQQAWFLPTLKLGSDLNSILNSNTFQKIYVSASTVYTVNDVNLLYGNSSHNSLNIRPEDSFSYRAVHDLFNTNSLNLEQVQTYNLNLNLRFKIGRMYYNFDATHFRQTTEDAVFPVFEADKFQLKNVATIKNKGLELHLGTEVRFDDQFRYKPSIAFSTHRPKVDRLLEARKRVPISGFTTVSQNLIEGLPTGVIVGSAYLRDANNAVVIGADGFPLVNPEPQVIGNAIPKYNLGIHQRISLYRFTLGVLIDVQKGGDVWNGTQNVLNYLGRSQESATERQRNNVVFNGVTAQGALNTQPVAFYDLENEVTESRFVRYGFEGVAETAIVDGSYINIKEINASYDFKPKRGTAFIRKLQLGLYAHNLFTWTKYRGASPYNTLYGNSSAKGLNFFNTPLASEVGVTFNLTL